MFVAPMYSVDVQEHSVGIALANQRTAEQGLDLAAPLRGRRGVDARCPHADAQLKKTQAELSRA